MVSGAARHPRRLSLRCRSCQAPRRPSPPPAAHVLPVACGSRAARNRAGTDDFTTLLTPLSGFERPRRRLWHRAPPQGRQRRALERRGLRRVSRYGTAPRPSRRRLSGATCNAPLAAARIRLVTCPRFPSFAASLPGLAAPDTSGSPPGIRTRRAAVFPVGGMPVALDDRVSAASGLSQMSSTW